MAQGHSVHEVIENLLFQMEEPKRNHLVLPLLRLGGGGEWGGGGTQFCFLPLASSPSLPSEPRTWLERDLLTSKPSVPTQVCTFKVYLSILKGLAGAKGKLLLKHPPAC